MLDIVDKLRQNQRLEHRLPIVEERWHGAQRVDLGVPGGLVGPEVNVHILPAFVEAELSRGPERAMRKWTQAVAKVDLFK